MRRREKFMVAGLIGLAGYATNMYRHMSYVARATNTRVQAETALEQTEELYKFCIRMTELDNELNELEGKDNQEHVRKILWSIRPKEQVEAFIPLYEGLQSKLDQLKKDIAESKRKALIIF